VALVGGSIRRGPRSGRLGHPPLTQLPAQHGGHDEDPAEDHEPGADREHHAERPELVEVAAGEGRHDHGRAPRQGHHEQGGDGRPGEKARPRDPAAEQEARGPPPQKGVGGELHEQGKRAGVLDAGHRAQQQRGHLQHEKPPQDPDDAAAQGPDAPFARQVPGAGVHPLEGTGEAGRRRQRDHRTDDTGLRLVRLLLERQLPHRRHHVVTQADHVADLLHHTLGPHPRHESPQHHEHRDEGEQCLCAERQ